MCVLHSCDNPPCVNPKHLFIGTQLENIADMNAKGRHGRGRASGERSGTAKLTWANVREIRRLYATGIDAASLGRRFGVTPTAAQFVVRHKTWKEPL